MHRKELVPGEMYAWLSPKSGWEILNELRRHNRVRYIGPSCVGMQDKPGYVVIAHQFSSESQRLIYVRSNQIMSTWDAYCQQKDDLENAACRARALRREQMEELTTEIRSLFGPDDVGFNNYEGNFTVSIAAMKYLLQLHAVGAAV